jgi:MYXO-CTERM domain-containing protein
VTGGSMSGRSSTSVLLVIGVAALLARRRRALAA